MLRHSPLILIADDDPEDRLLVKDALGESGWAHDARFVSDGEELLEYLLHQGAYRDPRSAPKPSLILLDLNMPKKDGRAALREIKERDALRLIPVVALTTSSAEEDVWKTYQLGASSYIQKPATFSGLVEAMRALGVYWFELVKLPG
jgi:CheY-like chemotaxis protein